jgi:hypothetical protein
MYLDSNPQEAAFRKAVAAVAAAAHDGDRRQVKEAQQRLTAAIAAFPEPQRDALDAAARHGVKAQLKGLRKEQEQSVSAREAWELQAALARWEQENEQGRGR